MRAVLCGTAQQRKALVSTKHTHNPTWLKPNTTTQNIKTQNTKHETRNTKHDAHAQEEYDDQDGLFHVDPDVAKEFAVVELHQVLSK
jgi:hypothetical protein